MFIENNVSVKPVASATHQSQKITYSIKRALKQLFSQHKSAKLAVAQNLVNAKKAGSLESIESLENQRNADIESECSSLESYENSTNERLAAVASSESCELEDYDFVDIGSVPVHFVRSEHGTFFWTAACELPADNDLIEPLMCCTSNQIAVAQLQDRWAQA